MSEEFARLIIRLLEMDDDERQRLLDEMKSSICAARKLQLEEFKAEEQAHGNDVATFQQKLANGSGGLPM